MRKYPKLLLITVIASLIFAAPIPLGATVQDEKDKLDDLKEKKGTVQETIDELESSKADTEKYIKEIDGQVTAITTQMHKNEQDIAAVKKKIKKTKKKIKKQEKNIEEQYAAMKLRIKYMYENGDTQMLDLILSSENIADFLNKAEYISEISRYDRDMLDKMKETKKKIEEAKVALEKSKKKKIAMQEKLENQKKDLEILAAAKEEELNEYDKLLKEGNAAKTALNTEIENQAAVVAEMESIEAARAEAAKKAAEEAKKAQNNTNNTNNADKNITFTGYTWPVPGYTYVSSDYGYRSDPFTGVTTYHSGIDIPAPAGTPIVAAASGEVAWATYSTTAGNWIGIDHGDGVYTVYMHASALLVSAGEIVEKGDTIALVGSTGRSTGNHLDFSVRVNGVHVSPWNYVSNK